MTPDTWPYCQHPECHNRRTVEYWDGGTTTSGWPCSPPPLRCAGFTTFTLEGRDDIRRWCHSHALLNEGWAYGGAA